MDPRDQDRTNLARVRVGSEPGDVETSAGPRKQHSFNRLVCRILRSPVSGTLDASLLLLTLRGRRSGRELEFPVQYAAADGAIWVWPGHPERKNWWRNLSVEAPLRIRLRGHELEATGRAISGAVEPAQVEEGLRAYLRRFPSAARGLALDRPGRRIDDAELREAAKRAVLVRIDAPMDAVRAAQAATIVPGRGALAIVRGHPLASYFLLTFALSWGYWIRAAIAGGHLSHFPGVMGPLISAFVVTAIARGKPGSKGLLARMGRWRVPLRWYAAAAAPFGSAILAFCALALVGQLPSA